MEKENGKLPSFLNDRKLSLLFFGGKGGVGKTTCAAATAVQTVKHGRKTLLMSINPAHSLSDIFEREIGGEITRIDENLYAVEINSEKLLEEYKRRYESQIKTIIERGTIADPEDINYFWDLSLPGLDELMAMLKLIEFAKEKKYGLFIVDMATVGHIIRFLTLPKLMKTMLDVLGKMQKRYSYIRETFTGKNLKDEFDEFLDTQIKDVENVISFISSRTETEFIPITIPESMGFEELKVLLKVIQQYKINVKNIILNTIWKSDTCAFCSARKNNQEKYVQQTSHTFSDYNIIQIPLFPSSIRGLKNLNNFGDVLSGKPYKFELKKVNEEEIELSNKERMNLEELAKRKLILFGGKGGLGKTTISTATSLALAETFPEKRILIFSTDPAQALGRSFGLIIGKKPTQIQKNLFAMAMDADDLLNEFKETYKEKIKEIFDAFSTQSAGMNMSLDKEIYSSVIDMSPPGLDELMALSKIVDLMKENKYDIFILDTAPSGHALRLLELPDLIMEWFRALIKVIRKYSGVIFLTEISLLILEKMKEIKGLITLLKDKNQTEFVVVTVPSKMEVVETKRLIARLQNIGMPLQRMFINKITPRSNCSFCLSRRKEEIENIKSIYNKYQNLVISDIPLFPHEIQGVDNLKKFSIRLYSIPVYIKSMHQKNDK